MMRHSLRRLATGFPAILLALGVVSAHAEAFEPQVGQPGKDVVWVPTPDALVEGMLRMAQVTPRDYVVDLGSGDGKIVIAAVRDFNARALGIEYNPDMVDLAQRNAMEAGVEARARFIQGDIFKEDFSSATVVTMYLLPALNLRLRETLLRMEPGTRVVSHAFDMSDWEPDDSVTVEGRSAFLWIVPADVGGTWRLTSPASQGAENAALSFTQRFQQVAGTITLRGTRTDLQDVRLVGRHIEFALDEGGGEQRRFVGRVEGDRMCGTVRSSDGETNEFCAERR